MPTPDVAKVLLDRRIMIVDDEPANLRLFGDFLRDASAGVLLFERPEDALAELADPRSRVDVLVTDVMMPQIDGAQFLASARRLRPTLPAVICTGYRDSAPARRVAGMDTVMLLAKPVHMHALVDAVASMCAGGEATDQTSAGES